MTITCFNVREKAAVYIFILISLYIPLDVGGFNLKKEKEKKKNCIIDLFLGTGKMPQETTKTYVIYPFECLLIFSFWCNVLMPRLCLG